MLNEIVRLQTTYTTQISCFTDSSSLYEHVIKILYEYSVYGLYECVISSYAQGRVSFVRRLVSVIVRNSTVNYIIIASLLSEILAWCVAAL